MKSQCAVIDGGVNFILAGHIQTHAEIKVFNKIFNVLFSSCQYVLGHVIRRQLDQFNIGSIRGRVKLTQ